MGKLFKVLFKIILSLVIILAVLVGVVVFLTYDGSKLSYTPSDTTISIEERLGDNLYDSIERIAAIDKDKRSDSSDNYLGVTVTSDELNDIVTDYVRKNYNENYLKDGDKTGIVSGYGVTLSSITFSELDGKIAAYAKVSFYDFYNSSLTLSGTPGIEGNKLTIKFEKFRLGKHMTISLSKVQGILSKLNVSLEGNDMFDVETMTLSFDISSVLTSVSPRFQDFLTNCTYSVDYTQATEDTSGIVSMKIATNNIFTNLYDIPATTDFYFPDLDPLHLSVTMSEADFNYLVQDNLGEIDFMDPVTLGTKEFKFGLDNAYYDIADGEVLAIASINSLKTNVEADVTVSPVTDGKYISEVDLVVSMITIGNQTVDSSNFFDKVTIPASTLTNGITGLKVASFEINKTDKTVTIGYSLGI